MADFQQVCECSHFGGQHANNIPGPCEVDGCGCESLQWARIVTQPSGPDMVNHPPHYRGFSNGAEVIDIAERLNFNRGNAIKYLARAGRKQDADTIADLEKAKWYVQREIDRIVTTDGKESRERAR